MTAQGVLVTGGLGSRLLVTGGLGGAPLPSNYPLTPSGHARWGSDELTAALGKFWNPVVLQGHFCDVFGSSYIDFELTYNGLDPLEINGIVVSYIWRDTFVSESLPTEE